MQALLFYMLLFWHEDHTEENLKFHSSPTFKRVLHTIPHKGVGIQKQNKTIEVAESRKKEVRHQARNDHAKLVL